MIGGVNAAMSKATPPSIFCEDFALIPRGPHAGKPHVTFGRPVNLLSAASGEGAAATGKPAAHVLVLNLDGQLYIRDLGGTASLQLNGNPTTQANLRHGDKVRLGKIEYEVNATRFVAARSETPGGRMAELLPTSGGAAMKVVTPVSLIGSSEHAELPLAGDNAPEAMAMILRIGQGYWLWNLEPASPCRVNGEVVVRVALGEGTLVSVGGQEFRFHLLPEPASPQAQAPAKRADKSPVRSTRAPTGPAPRKTPTVTAEAAPPAPATPPISTPQPIAKPEVPAKLPAPPTPAPPPPAIQKPPLTTPATATPEEEADVFKQWGPLAFAVAAADRPELQAGGSKPGAVANVPVTPGPRRSRLSWAILLVILLLLGGGIVLAWRLRLWNRF